MNPWNIGIYYRLQFVFAIDLKITDDRKQKEYSNKLKITFFRWLCVVNEKEENLIQTSESFKAIRTIANNSGC